MIALCVLALCIVGLMVTGRAQVTIPAFERKPLPGFGTDDPREGLPALARLLVFLQRLLKQNLNET